MGKAEDLLKGVRQWCASGTQELDNLERFLDQNADAVAGDQRAARLAQEVRTLIVDARRQHPDEPHTAAQAARMRLSAQLAPD